MLSKSFWIKQAIAPLNFTQRTRTTPILCGPRELYLSLSFVYLSMYLSMYLSIYLSIYIDITLVKTLGITPVKTRGNFVLKCTYCMAVHNALRDIFTVQCFPDSWKFTTHCYHKTNHSSYKRSAGRKKIP